MPNANKASPACPECEMLARASDKSQVIGEFMDWLLNEQEYVLAQWGTVEMEDGLIPCHPDIQQLLARFFGIDLGKVEQERRALLDAIREKEKL